MTSIYSGPRPFATRILIPPSNVAMMLLITLTRYFGWLLSIAYIGIPVRQAGRVAYRSTLFFASVVTLKILFPFFLSHICLFYIMQFY